MSKHLVLSVKEYDFKNGNGERVVGAKVTYLNKKSSSREGERGFPPLIVSISNMELVSSMKEIPAVYEMDFEQVTGKNNKPELILTDVEMISPVDMSQIF